MGKTLINRYSKTAEQVGDVSVTFCPKAMKLFNGIYRSCQARLKGQYVILESDILIESFSGCFLVSSITSDDHYTSTTSHIGGDNERN